jgi:hypothetical protein
MKPLVLTLMALSAPWWASFVLAQPVPGAMAPGGHCGPGAAASAAAADCPQGPNEMHGKQGSRRQAGMHHTMRAGPHNTSGWPMMTAAERQAHHNKLRGFKSHDECKAYMDDHHAQMLERAKTAGRKAPAMPTHDVCLAMKPAQK